jgi:hypothetical protein
MANSNTFVLQEVIDDLVNTDKSLVSPLMKLSYFGRLIKNTELVKYTTEEIEGYRAENAELPSYRKRVGTLEVDLQAMHNRHKVELPVSLLDEPFRDGLRYMKVREGIATIEEMVANGLKKGDFIYTPVLMEMLPYFQAPARKLYRSDVRIDVVGGRLKASSSIMVEILSTVRSKLLAFTMDVAEKFGHNIEIASFKEKQEQNNQTIINYMKTEITNTGDANIINTGEKAQIDANITVTKGDIQKLNQALSKQGIEEEDISELNTIVTTEEPDLQNKRLGQKANDWIMKIIGKGLSGIGKIGTGISSNILATLIKQFYGMDG